MSATVLSCGLACPVGLLSATALAAMHGGIRSFVESEHVRDRAGEPVRASILDRLPPDTPRMQRALTLARYALIEALEPLSGGGHTSVSCFVATPSGPGIDLPRIHRHLDAIAREVSGVGLELREDRTFVRGRAAVFEALQAAIVALTRGECGLALVGGLDSLVDPLSLRMLANGNRVLSSQNRDGMIPGEAAAFIVLERGGNHGSRITSCATGPSLTHVFGELRRSRASRVDVVLSAQTGESSYERAFSYAYLRNSELMPEPLRSISTGAKLGDAGVAAGALALVAAVTEPPRYSSVLVYAESDDEFVGGCIVESRLSPPRMRTIVTADRLLRDIEARHLDEAEFLLERREAAFEAPNISLEDLARGHERRLLTHVHALSVGGPIVAERTLMPVLRLPAGPEQAAAAVLGALEGGHTDVWGKLRTAVDREDAEDLRIGVTMALRMCDEDFDSRIVESLHAVEGPGTAMWLDILAHRGAATGEWLLPMLASRDVRVVRAAARLARHTTARSVLDAVASLAGTQDAGLREAVLTTALIRGVAGAWDAAVYWALNAPEQTAAGRRTALTWLAVLGDASVVPLLLDDIWALGFSGWPAAVDQCVDRLADAHVGRLAGEAICAITGLSASEPGVFRSSARRDDSLPPLKDDLGTELVPDGEDALPWPEPQAIAAWWASRRPDFDPATRYLDGRPADGASLLAALHSAPLRRRHVLAFELAARSGGAAWVDTRASVAGQRARLARFASLELNLPRSSRT